jgi:malate permease and related proteins
MVARGAFSPKESIFRILKIPVIYASVFGIAVQVFSIPIPSQVERITDYAKGGLVILGLLLVGLSIASLPDIKTLKGALEKKFVGYFLAVKFLFWPCLSWFLCYLDMLYLQVLSNTQKEVVFLISLAPAAVNIVVYANLFEVEPAKAATLVIILTAIASIFIPIAGILL